MKLTSVPVLLALSTAIRAGMIAWGHYQDKHFSVKYTDIDYSVSKRGTCMINYQELHDLVV